MSSPLSTLETDLEVLAKPVEGSGTGAVKWKGSTGSEEPVLAAVKAMFETLEQVGEGIGPAIKTVAGDIGTGLDAGAEAIDLIAEQLEKVSSAVGGTVADVASVLASLQNALSTAQSLLPGGPSVTAPLQSGSEFFGMLQSLLSDPAITSIEDAITYLYKIAQELRAVGTALSS